MTIKFEQAVAAVSDLTFENIQSLHLTDLDRLLGLNLFRCPVEEIYPVEEVNGVVKYLQPSTTHRNYTFFKAVKKTRLRASLGKQFGPDIARLVMNRYTTFEYEFETFCWGNRYRHIKLHEDMCKGIWLRDIIDIAQYFTAKSEYQIEQPESVLNADIGIMEKKLKWLENNSEGRSRRKDIALQQWRSFVVLARQYPTNWQYYCKNGSPLDLLASET